MDILHYTEEHRIFREALRKFFEKEVIPLRRRMGGSGDRPPKRLEEDGRPGLSLPHGSGGIRRGRGGLSLFRDRL